MTVVVAFAIVHRVKCECINPNCWVKKRDGRSPNLADRLRARFPGAFFHDRVTCFKPREDGSGAPGIDQETVKSYGANLVSNLRDPEERVHSGRYQASPVRRVYIPKGTGSETRPIGIPTVEDYWGRSRKGRWVVKRKTARGRIRRALTRIAQWCRANRHQPIPFQHRRLSEMFLGHQAYYGVTGNMRWLQRVRERILAIWRKWLNRRSRSRGGMAWPRFREVPRNLRFPRARVVHSVLIAKP